MTPQKIRVIRAYFGWTQTQLAEELGVQLNTVARWENGTRNPSGAANKSLERLWERLRGESVAV